MLSIYAAVYLRLQETKQSTALSKWFGQELRDWKEAKTCKSSWLKTL